MVELTEPTTETTETFVDASVPESEQIHELVRESDITSPISPVPAPMPVASDTVITGSHLVVPPQTTVYSTSSRKTTGEIETPRTDELEALWPGVHQEFIQPVKRTPSFYMMLGFIGGAVVSLIGVWGYSAVSTQVAINQAGADKPIVVAKEEQKPEEQPLTSKNVDPTSDLVPISSTYEVKAGDTLVSIAIKNYRRVTPRLVDQIVETNGLKNANVLNLGQTLKLPTYRPQASKIAVTETERVN